MKGAWRITCGLSSANNFELSSPGSVSKSMLSHSITSSVVATRFKAKRLSVKSCPRAPPLPDGVKTKTHGPQKLNLL